MPAVECVCGNRIGLGDIPSKNQLMIISDHDLDKFGDNIDMDLLFQKMNIVAKCSACGRLHIFWNGFDKEQTIYKPENL